MAISQLHSMVTSLSTVISDVQTRVTVLEVHPATAFPDMVAVIVLAPPPAGTPEMSLAILPVHLVTGSIRKDILEGKDVNLASFLSVHDLAKNKSYALGDISVVLKSKGPRLNRKLTVTEFCLGFRDVERRPLLGQPQQEGRAGPVPPHSTVRGIFVFMTITVHFWLNQQPSSCSFRLVQTGVSSTQSSSAATLPVSADRGA